MTSHELARQLLAGPDLPVALTVACDDDSVSGVNRLTVKPGSYSKDRVYVCSDGEWRDRLNPDGPTHVFVEARSDQEFRAETVEDEEELDDD